MTVSNGKVNLTKPSNNLSTLRNNKMFYISSPTSSMATTSGWSTMPTATTSTSAVNTSATAGLTRYSNVTLMQDPMDMYCNSVGHVKFERGVDCRIELPGGQMLCIDEDGEITFIDLALEKGGAAAHLERPKYAAYKSYDTFNVRKGKPCAIHMLDGSIIYVDDMGNYQIDDTDATVVYQANRQREFNRFMNASDCLEEFVEYLGSLSRPVRQSELMDLPIELFINWLIIRAAEQDGDETPDDISVDGHPALHKEKHRCLYCGRFIPQKNVDAGVHFCSKDHMLAHTSEFDIF